MTGSSSKKIGARMLVGASGAADAFEAVTHQVQRVLGGVEQHAAGPRDRVLPQTRGAGGDRDGEIEGEERLAALGLATDDADRFLRPELLDQPVALLGPIGQTVRELDRQEAHRRRPATAAFAAAGDGTAKTSR